MTAKELKQKFPALYDEIFNEGVQMERTRLKTSKKMFNNLELQKN
jgi:hypothetical protein